MKTTSRRSSVGAIDIVRRMRGMVVRTFIGPSITNGCDRHRRGVSPTTRVMVFQWPCGTEPNQSFAPRANGRRSSHQAGAGGGLVDKHQSGGIKQALLANPGAAAPAPRPPVLARSRAGFFSDGDIMSLEKSPDRGATAWDSLLAHRPQRSRSKVRSGCSATRARQPFHLLLQRRRTPAAQLCCWCFRCHASAATTSPPNWRSG